MKRFLYVWVHIPTGERGIKVVKYLDAKSFYRDVSRWNSQQPETWAYCPL